MLVARCLAATLLIVLPISSAPAQQPKVVADAPGLGQIEIPEAELDRYIAKSNAVVGLLNTSQRAADSLSRYSSWVNIKTGPTSKERIIYGLYSVGVSSATSASNKARQATFDAPRIPALDAATHELADAFDALVPILNEAEAYYARKDYLTDDMAAGKKLHARIVPAGNAFLAARQRAFALQDEFKDAIDLAQLARIENAEGKSVRWHAVNAQRFAKKAVELMPASPKIAPDQLKAFDAALTAFGEAVKGFDDAVQKLGKSPPGASSPRDILGRLREMRAEIGQGRVNEMSFSMQRRGIITSYNMMIRMSNVLR